MYVKPYTLDPLTNKVNTKLIDISENDTLMIVQDKLGRYDPFGKLLNQFISHTTIDKEKEAQQRIEQGKSTFINKFMLGLAGLLIFYLVGIMWDYVYEYFSYDKNDINYMQYLDIDFDDVANDKSIILYNMLVIINTKMTLIMLKLFQLKHLFVPFLVLVL